MKKACGLVFIAIALLTSCNETSIHNPEEIIIPDSNVSFQNHVLPVLRYSCGLSYCHGEIAPQANVMIYDYYTLMFSYGGALVIPRQPDGSVLVQIIEYRLPHKPTIVWKITENQRKGIRRWILEGAFNN
ncbi:MAG: hypothetical protein N2517_02130 [Ignavibacteria bacterium]|nr:hypothetical protein [Ignavibacteria bacterium]